MSVSTSSSPYFTLDAAASLFGLVNDKIDAVIANDGISFEMDYGAILETKMACKLADYHNFQEPFLTDWILMFHYRLLRVSL